ncbi:MAG: hypothetical protein ACRYG7_05700 [Janthinobacterium lividum]
MEEARLELAEYLDHYYNTQRLRPGLLHPTRNRTPLPLQPTLARCPFAPDHPTERQSIAGD